MIHRRTFIYKLYIFVHKIYTIHSHVSNLQIITSKRTLFEAKEACGDLSHPVAAGSFATLIITRAMYKNITVSSRYAPPFTLTPIRCYVKIFTKLFSSLRRCSRQKTLSL